MNNPIEYLDIIIQTIGGLGLFLLGMIIMTDGLRELAGDTIRTALMRFTRSPVTGVISGAASTAVLQSSSATTVAAVGFVGVGILSFQEALGIILGANIGTTMTGWIVVMLGFKLKLGTLMMPVVFFGAVLRLFSHGKLSAIGYSLAGFGLIFIGITMMQQGMSGLDAFITPEDLPPDTITGRLSLVAIGIMTTLITQSSSAGVATTITALYAGAINLEQGMALIIGMDTGTTVTAVLATLGRTVNAKRTGYSHVAYNLFAGTSALFLISPYILLITTLFPGRSLESSGIALIAFHTSYNTLGVLVVLPFFNRAARFMERLIPELPLIYTRQLDPALLNQPAIALNVVQSTISQELLALLAHTSAILGDTTTGYSIDLHELQLALNDTQDYTDHIQLNTKEGEDWKRLISIIHALDHMQRLHERCEEDADRAMTVKDTPLLNEARTKLVDMITDITGFIKNNQWIDASKRATETEDWIKERMQQLRHAIMMKIAGSDINAAEGTRYLEALRWTGRVSKHISHITRHYYEGQLAGAGEIEL